MEFINGKDSLEKKHFEQIMSSISWKIVSEKIAQKEKCSYTNISKFKMLLVDKGFSDNAISLLSKPLMNDNLIFICSRMHELEYSSNSIAKFKIFLLALFATDSFLEIIDFQKSIEIGDYEKVYLYLSSGFRPNWIIGNNLETGLMTAIENETQSIIDLLLSCPSINLEATDRQGKNSLMLAIQKENFALARTLLKYQGWNLLQKDIAGYSAYDFAATYLPHLYRALEEYRQQFPQYQQA